MDQASVAVYDAIRCVAQSALLQRVGLQAPWTFVDAAKGALADKPFQLKAAKLGAALLQQLWQDEKGRLEPHEAAGVAGHPLCGAGPPGTLHHRLLRP